MTASTVAMTHTQITNRKYTTTDIRHENCDKCNAILYYVNDKKLQFIHRVTVTYQKTAKIIQTWYYPLSCHLNVNVMLSIITLWRTSILSVNRLSAKCVVGEMAAPRNMHAFHSVAMDQTVSDNLDLCANWEPLITLFSLLHSSLDKSININRSALEHGLRLTLLH